MKALKKQSKDEPELIRLNKMIADCGYSSRRKADEVIKEGRVKVNNKTVTDLGTKVRMSDEIKIDGDILSHRIHHTYILLNKPKDFITTTSDELGRKAVVDLVRIHTRLFPVGRLDRNTTGVLLLTNDGELTNRLTHPKYKVERIYVAGLNKRLDPRDAKLISEGVELDDIVTSPCELMIDIKDETMVTIAIREGKNREIRRIFEHFGYDVKKLDRKYYANLSTKGLNRGEYRHLTRQEILDLKKILKMPV
jgi:23S rRNA pseudouridine2605 synthase